MEGAARRCSIMIVVALGFFLGGLLVSGLSRVDADGNVDLTVELEAPAHIADGSTYLVRIAYYNLGANIPPRCVPA